MSFHAPKRTQKCGLTIVRVLASLFASSTRCQFSSDRIVTRNGIHVIPAHTTTSWPTQRLLPTIGTTQPVTALRRALDGIAVRYGIRTAQFAAMQLEYLTEDSCALSC